MAFYRGLAVAERLEGPGNQLACGSHSHCPNLPGTYYIGP